MWTQTGMWVSYSGVTSWEGLPRCVGRYGNHIWRLDWVELGLQSLPSFSLFCKLSSDSAFQKNDQLSPAQFTCRFWEGQGMVKHAALGTISPFPPFMSKNFI